MQADRDNPGLPRHEAGSLAQVCARSLASMSPTMMAFGPIALCARTPPSIGRSSASAPSHHDLFSAAFITNIAGSRFSAHTMGESDEVHESGDQSPAPATGSQGSRRSLSIAPPPAGLGRKGAATLHRRFPGPRLIFVGGRRAIGSRWQECTESTKPFDTPPSGYDLTSSQVRPPKLERGD